jgi:hypothetical protein
MTIRQLEKRIEELEVHQTLGTPHTWFEIKDLDIPNYSPKSHRERRLYAKRRKRKPNKFSNYKTVRICTICFKSELKGWETPSHKSETWYGSNSSTHALIYRAYKKICKGGKAE